MEVLELSTMVKPPAKKKAKKATAQSIESNAIILDDLDPDAWPKFEKLVKNASKMGHQPHVAALKGKSKR